MPELQEMQYAPEGDKILPEGRDHHSAEAQQTASAKCIYTVGVYIIHVIGHIGPFESVA